MTSTYGEASSSDDYLVGKTPRPSTRIGRTYTVYSDEWPMGRIYEERGAREEMRWYWSFFGILARKLASRLAVEANVSRGVVLFLQVACTFIQNGQFQTN